MLTIQVHSEGATERLELAARSFRELRPVFNMFAAWLREDVQRVFDTEGEGTWPKRQNEGTASQQQRIAANVARIEANKYRSLQGSLRSSRAKAERRLQRTTDSKLLTRRQRSVARYDAQLAEVARVAGGGTAQPEGQKKLYDRLARREALAQKRIQKAQEGKLLAGMASSLRSEVGSDFFRMYSRIPWAYVHNEGGTGGKGAQEPKRTFLEWTPARIRKFVEMANAYLADKAAKKAAK